MVLLRQHLRTVLQVPDLGVAPQFPGFSLRPDEFLQRAVVLDVFLTAVMPKLHHSLASVESSSGLQSYKNSRMVPTWNSAAAISCFLSAAKHSPSVCPPFGASLLLRLRSERPVELLRHLDLVARTGSRDLAVL